jgi:CHAT domain-containing protein/Flp pilus assembly protein TadD
MESFQQSLKLYEEMNDKTTTAVPMNNMARLLSLHGDYDAARDYLEKTLAIFQESGQKGNVASILMNIGNVDYARGNHRLSLQNTLKALEIYQEIGDQFGATDALTNIAGLYEAQGNYDLALETFEKALKQYESLNAKPRAAVVMTSIGSVFSLKGGNDSAIRFLNDSLKIKNEVGDVEGKSTTLVEIGLVYSSAKKYSLAMDSYRKSLKISEELNDIEKIAQVNFLMAKDHYSTGNYALATELAERSYNAAAKIPHPDLIWQAKNISGKAYMAQQDFNNAQKSFDDAINAVEAMRFQVAGGEQETQRFFELRTAPYYAMVKLLINQNRYSEALNYAERAKGRVVLDVLQTGKIDVTKAMTSEEQQQEKKINFELASINKQIYNESLNEKPDAALLSDLKLNLEKLRLKQDAFRTALYAAHPELQAQRGEGTVISFEKQADIFPDHSTALMEFVVTDENTYLFVLTPVSTTNPSLILNAYTIPESDRSLAKRVEVFRNQLATRIGFRNSAKELFDLLIKPAQKDLKDKTTLVIVPDGALWQLPFQAVMASSDRYLVEDYAISFSPSLSVLSQMLKQKKEDGATKSLEKLLAFGNPSLGKTTAKEMKLTYRGEKLVPLPQAEKEVERIAKLYSSDSKVFIGVEAGEDRLKAEAANYDVLHMATHGVFDDKSPMYSHLVLSQSTDPSKEDGLLEAWEIMKMDLQADIVVLSACDTARGKIGSGEGVIGLTWAFFVAGCPATVVSQWEVESASTSELMLAFHENLKKSGLTVSKALQQAELKLLRSDQYRHPFYWAPFVVIGAGF